MSSIRRYVTETLPLHLSRAVSKDIRSLSIQPLCAAKKDRFSGRFSIIPKPVVAARDLSKIDFFEP